ncbi:MAG: hypothetical protein HUU21_21410 [Polyangiaceae bacterium]|nr:hypothetical protein [Polyangiaceae bacterium]
MAAWKDAKQRPNGGVTEQRVKVICDLMSSGRWVTHLSAQQLAQAWSLKPQTVENLACEASRRLRALVHDSPELKARIVTTLEKIVQECMTKGERRTAVEALRVMLGVVDKRSESQQPLEPTRHTVVIEEAPDARPTAHNPAQPASNPSQPGAPT